MQIVSCVLRQAQCTVVGEKEVHFRGSLGTGSDLENHAHAVECFFLAGVRDVQGRCKESDGSSRRTGPQARAQCSVRPYRKHDAGVEHPAPQHRSARIDVLGDRVFEEMFRSDDRHRRVSIDNAEHPTEVVYV